MIKKNNELQIVTLEDAIHVIKENKTEVWYYIFEEYEIHMNKIPPNSIQEWHYHREIEEVIMVTKGVLTCHYRKGKEEYHQNIEKGQMVLVNTSIHTFENRSLKEVEFIAFRLVLTNENKSEKIKNDKVIVE